MPVVTTAITQKDRRPEGKINNTPINVRHGVPKEEVPRKVKRTYVRVGTKHKAKENVGEMVHGSPEAQKIRK